MKSNINDKVSIVKLTAIATLFGCSISINQASANSGVIHFLGSVTDVTCDIVAISEDGVESNVIDLGTVNITDNAGTEVPFKLQPRTGTTCSLTGKTTADIGWASEDLVSYGLNNGKGTATGFGIKLTHGSTEINTSVTNTALTLPKDPSDVPYFEASYKAQMIANGATKAAGTVESNATFTVAYK